MATRGYNGTLSWNLEGAILLQAGSSYKIYNSQLDHVVDELFNSSVEEDQFLYWWDGELSYED